MPGQIVAPTPLTPGRSLDFTTSQDLYASIAATLNKKGPRTTVTSIPVDDYSVPPNPPPSPVSFRTEKKWQGSPLRH